MKELSDTTQKYEVMMATLEEKKHVEIKQLIQTSTKSQRLLEDKCNFLEQQYDNLTSFSFLFSILFLIIILLELLLQIFIIKIDPQELKI